MIKIGDVVFVGTKGICELQDIRKNAFVGCEKDKEYYILKPVDTQNNMVAYLPTETKVKIRKVASKKDASEIFENFEDIKGIEVDSESERLEKYQEFTNSAELKDIAKLLKTVLERKVRINKKQFSFQEQKYLNIAENCFTDEISYVLNMPKNEVKTKIYQKVR